MLSSHSAIHPLHQNRTPFDRRTNVFGFWLFNFRQFPCKELGANHLPCSLPLSRPTPHRRPAQATEVLFNSYDVQQPGKQI